MPFQHQRSRADQLGRHRGDQIGTHEREELRTVRYEELPLDLCERNPLRSDDASRSQIAGTNTLRTPNRPRASTSAIV